MKRGAEKQLSKDDDPDDQVEEVQTGFQLAKDSDLAKREIRGLPKRRSPAVAPASGVPPPPSSSNPAVTPKFSTFSGFGSTGGATTPFTFAPSTLAGTPHKSAEAPQLSPPVVSDSASNATKKFASFLGPSSTAGAKPVLPSETPKPDASGDTDEVALKYYTSLRGLNSSLLSAVSKAIESDPFVDVADILEQYKKHRISVQQEYDGKSFQPTTQSTSTLSTKPSIPAAPLSFGKPATSAPTTMSTGFTAFSAPSAPLSSAAPASGFTSFTPTLSASGAKSSFFNFPAASSTSSDSKPAGVTSSSPSSGFGTSSSSLFKSTTPFMSKEAESTPPLKSAFAFGTSPAAGSTASTLPFGSSQPSSSTSLFGNPPKTSTLFGPDKSASEDKDKDGSALSAPAVGPSPFSSVSGTKLFGDTVGASTPGSIFGSATTKSDKDKEKEGEKEKDSSSKPSLPPIGSVFGTSFGSSAKPSPFSFGTTSSTTTPASFGFGVASTGASEGSPPPKAGNVGFSFGSPSRTSSPASSSIFGSAPTPAPAPAPAGSTGTTPAPGSTPHVDVASSAAPRADTPATEGSLDEEALARTQSPGLHGGEGDGEEDEETTYTVKSKVFKFTTDREGAHTWSEMGIGMLRLKKHKETNARRVILRSSATGKIIINFRIYTGLLPKRTGKTVAFTGHITSPGKDTQTVQYRLRVATEAAATEMAEAIEREVRLVQAESTPTT
ncbi:hypothetical protein BGW80DRAFT_684921 [Lactifluus volemus]|nr:hypothetical protein BGW80DRAFT_684921 [Lactifluus volemus]